MEIKRVILMMALLGFSFGQLISLSGCGPIKVTGKVIDIETGKQTPLKGIEVKIIVEGEDTPIATTITNEIGEFTFQNLKLEEEKRYNLICEGPTFDKREIRINPTEQEPITIVVTLNYAIEGRITTFTTEPIPQATVFLLTEDKKEVARRSSDSNGKFSFSNFKYNKVNLRVECQNYIPCESEDVITLQRGAKMELENDIQLEKILTPTYEIGTITVNKIKVKVPPVIH
ncbi:MAG: carboxypeptidase-like regulatory domain-containing protein [bacterium]